jgi:hypothetical protein
LHCFCDSIAAFGQFSNLFRFVVFLLMDIHSRPLSTRITKPG